MRKKSKLEKEIAKKVKSAEERFLDLYLNSRSYRDDYSSVMLFNGETAKEKRRGKAKEFIDFCKKLRKERKVK